jgi:hypothetical protein
MRLALAFSLIAAPALAQETAPAPDPAPDGEGFSLMEEGAKLVLRGLMTEMQPALDEMGKALNEVRPALEDFSAEVRPKINQLIALIDDFGNYDAPVMLPNGDILIRRNAPTPPLVPLPRLPDMPVPGPTGEIEL